MVFKLVNSLRKKTGFLTLEKESTGLFYSSSGHSKPYNGVSPHGLGPQFGLHPLMK